MAFTMAYFICSGTYSRYLFAILEATIQVDDIATSYSRTKECVEHERHW